MTQTAQEQSHYPGSTVILDHIYMIMGSINKFKKIALSIVLARKFTDISIL